MNLYVKTILGMVVVVLFGVATWQTSVCMSESKNHKQQAEDLKKQMDKMNSDFANSTRNFTSLEQKVKLLGTLHNENWAACMNGKIEDVIFIQRDWKISSNPKYLDLNIQDNDWVSKFVDEPQKGAND